MNKIIKYAVSFLLMLSFQLTSINPKESISQIPKEDYSYEIVGDNVLQDAAGNHLVFESRDEMDSYLSYVRQLRVCLPGDPGYPNCDSYVQTTITDTYVSTSYISKKFIDYTPTWSPSNGYTLTTSRTETYSTSVSYDNLSFGVSVTVSKGVAINIPATASRYSSLCIRADITAKKYYRVIKNAATGAVISSYYYIIPTVTNTYNDVIYLE